MRAWRSRSARLRLRRGRLRELSGLRGFWACGNEDAVLRAFRRTELNTMQMCGGWIERNSVPMHLDYSDAVLNRLPATRRQGKGILCGVVTLTS